MKKNEAPFFDSDKFLFLIAFLFRRFAHKYDMTEGEKKK
jgi:hypothetical protein